MNNIEHYALSEHCRNLKALEKVLQGLNNRRWAAEDAGRPAVVLVPIDAAIATLALSVASHGDGLRTFSEFLPDEIRAWLAEANGVSEKNILYVMGLIPQLDEFPAPGHLLSYCGLAPKDGRAPIKAKGKRLGHNGFITGVAIGRVAVSIIKMSGGVDKNGRVRSRSPYRDVYDDRRAWTMESHPPMMLHGECAFCDEATAWTKDYRAQHEHERQRKSVGKDCSNMGGVHWTDGHRHRDATRVIAREVFIDLWRTSRGQEPRYGSKEGQFSDDAKKAIALSAVV